MSKELRLTCIFFEVTASWREPFEGWIDNAGGTTGIMLGGYLGLISSVLCGENLVLDMIPVDIVVNTLAASAFYVSSFRLLLNSIIVYKSILC